MPEIMLYHGEIWNISLLGKYASGPVVFFWMVAYFGVVYLVTRGPKWLPAKLAAT